MPRLTSNATIARERQAETASPAVDEGSSATSFRWTSMGLSVAIFIAFVWLVVFTLLTLFTPLLDAFGFRQTQTAINVYSILHDHVFLAYLTPVLGAPWSLPFEAPVYQFFVALLTYVTRLDLDAAGRIVCVAFFCGTLWCGLRTVTLVLPGDKYAPKLFVLFALVSPLYLFWSRTFMVETCALFFAMAWLMCVIQGLIERSVSLLFLSIPLGILGALAKVTTWPAFVAGYGLFVVADLYRNRTSRVRVQSLLFGAAGILLAFVLTLAWTKYSDQLKLLNPFARFLTSQSLNRWNFGTWSQRFSEKMWLDLLPTRMLPDAIGYCWPILLLCIRYVRLDSERTILAVACIVLFLLPIATFTNLYIIHDYYLTANAIFAIAAAIFLISEVIAVGRPIVAAVLVVFLISGAAARFVTHEWVWATAPLHGQPSYVAATLVANSTPPDSSLIVFGVDWSSEVHYYAERKGVALPNWATLEQAKTFLDDPDAIMGGLRTLAVVDCRAVFQHYPSQIDELVTQFVNR